MLISHKKKFIYTKTMKTAGSSVENFFEKFCVDNDWISNEICDEYIGKNGIVGTRSGLQRDIQSSIWWNHMPAITIKALIGNSIWNDYHKFCVIRNPFTKMVSAYKYFNHFSFRKKINLNEIIKNTKNFLTGNYIKQDFENWLLNTKMPLDRNKYVIDNEFCMDSIVRFENLLIDLEKICNNLNVKFDKNKLVHFKKNLSSKVDYSSFYTNKSIDIVARAYEFELEKFNYKLPW